MVVDFSAAAEHGLSREEYEKIISILGRVPTYTELGIYSVMWSEHCSYKSSIAELKKLPRSGTYLLVEAGEENAGLVDIGDELAIAFKIESHNHPSAVEPYQGAATGVGGIMRDIFTMGARPIASLDSLRFGDLDKPRTVYLMKGVVKGIGDYGNSFGVPTVAGDVFFDSSFDENPLVNAMAVGIVRHEQIARAIAHGEGNLVMIVGSSTGRDGIHGATFASENISEESESKRPSVQVGDPFTEKLLLEATLEVIQRNLVIAIQDMGAAGIICSTSEMSAKGKTGMEINLDSVPLREKDMSPYEIMLSESQERMLLVVSPKCKNEVSQIYSKWDLQCSVIGKVTRDGMIRVSKGGVVFAEVPAESLVLGGGAPVYTLESRVPGYLAQREGFFLPDPPKDDKYSDILLALLSSPNICSRAWIRAQYDSSVRTDTVRTSGDAAIIRVKGTRKAIALKTDCNSRYVYWDPYCGAQIAVAESARNVACTGAKPIAITNCLNFGNPNNPEIYWQFKEVIRGIGDACRCFDTPVTGGNVSFYNESPAGPIYPSPVIGMLGIIPDVSLLMTPEFKQAGDLLYLLGDIKGHLGMSEYLKIVFKAEGGDVPGIVLEDEQRLHEVLLQLISNHAIQSAHDVSEGGLAVTLAECCIQSKQKGKYLGAEVETQPALRCDAYLFGEEQSRVLVSVAQDAVRTFTTICARRNQKFTLIGKVVRDRLVVGSVVDVEVGELEKAYEVGLFGD